MKLKQIDIIERSTKQLLKLVERLKETTVLIDEEDVLFIIPKANVIIKQCMDKRLGISHTEISIDDYKNELKIRIEWNKKYLK